ncbi:DNA polymerase IV [Spiroplasma eriocheiris]|uniref:DNA polymerase IV n=1 Tax=Spiroplasma eriocheiris TaxID=315358 RepID=A0A0H3XMK2_9MOLU|nr:DNA polymerase IV [Spiroplasma eriocheiris]AHF57741.1 putative DNA polymerase IV [Spiroplasma eriocheiris CCTCC M 207170]AKM54192.1 DNA polymerase IV [Spiroplasma eriocheiris]
MRVIFHIDMNSFFASCHSAINPDLQDKPLVVSSPSRRAIVTTANYAARSYGVQSAMPLYQAKKLCRDLVIVDSDYQLYVNFAQKLFDYIANNYTEKIEVASIDECYLDVTELYPKYHSALNLAKEIQSKIYQDLGLSNSIGISYNKVLAKLASDLKKPMGITIIRDSDLATVVHPLAVNKLWGVGKITTQKLATLNIKTIGDLAHYDNPSALVKLIGSQALALMAHANGEGNDEINLGNNSIKSIANETTLEYDLDNFEEIKAKITFLANQVARRSKKRNIIGNVIYVVLKYSDRKKHSKQITLSHYTNDINEILPFALNCFEKLWNGSPVRLIGVGLAGIINKYDLKEQLTWDNFLTSLPTSDTEKLIKKINRHFKQDILLTGTKLNELKYLRQKQNRYLQADRVEVESEKKKNAKNKNKSSRSESEIPS